MNLKQKKSEELANWLQAQGIDGDIAFLLGKKYKNKKLFQKLRQRHFENFFSSKHTKNHVKDDKKLESNKVRLFNLIKPSNKQKKDKEKSQDVVKKEMEAYLTKTGVNENISKKLFETFGGFKIFLKTKIQKITNVLKKIKEVDQRTIQKLIESHERLLQNPSNRRASSVQFKKPISREISKAKQKTIQAIEANISKSKALLEALAKSPETESVSVLRVINTLELEGLNRLYLSKLGKTHLQRELRNRLDWLERDKQYMLQRDSSWDDLSRRVKDSFAFYLYSVEKNKLKKTQRLGKVFSAVALEGDTWNSEIKSKFTLSSPFELEKFKESIRSHGMSFLKLNETASKTQFQMEGCWQPDSLSSFSRSVDAEKLGDLFEVQILDKQKANLRISLNSLRFEDPVSERLARLSEIGYEDYLKKRRLRSNTALRKSSEVAKLPQNDRFEAELVRFEDEVGSLVNLGGFEIGGLLMLTASVCSAPTAKHKHIRKMLRQKIQNAKFLKFLDVNAYTESFKDDLSKKQRENQQLYNAIRLDSELIGSERQFSSIESFHSRILGSSGDWQVTNQEFDFVYVADLLTTDANIARLRSKGLSTRDVLHLKQRMWQSFRRRHRNAPRGRVVDDSISIFSAEERRQMLKGFEAKMGELQRRYKANPRELVSVVRLHELSFWEFKCERNLWNWFKNNRFASMEAMTRMQSALLGELKRGASDSANEQLMLRFFDLWSISRQKFADPNNVNNSLFWKLIERQRELFASKKEKLAVECEKFGAAGNQLDLDQLGDTFLDFFKFAHQMADAGSFDLAFEMNCLLGQIKKHNLGSLQIAQDLALRFCLFKFLDVSPREMVIEKPISLGRLKTFVEEYIARGADIARALTRGEAQETETRVVTFLTRELTVHQKADFISFLYSTCKFRLTDSVLYQHLFDPGIASPDPPSIEVKSTLGSFLKKLGQMRRFRPKKETRRSSHSLDWEEDHLEKARILCGGRESLGLRDILEIQTDPLSQESSNSDMVWKYVLRKLTNKEDVSRISLGAESGGCVEDYVTALFVLGSNQFRRVIINCLSVNQRPLPIVCQCRFVYLAPLSGLSLRFRDRQGNVTELNPFLHSSFKIVFIKTEAAKKSTAELANQLFYDEKDFYAANTRHTELQINVNASFITNIENEKLGQMSELTMLLVQSSPFQSLGCLERFLIEISDVVVLLRKSTCLSQSSRLRDYVRHLHRKRGENDQRLLMDVVEDSEPKDCPEFYDNWYRKLHLEANFDNFPRQFMELLMFQRINHSLGHRSQPLVHLDRLRFDGMQLDLQSSNLRPLLGRARRLIKQLEQKQSGAFWLQDHFHGRLVQAEKNLKHVKVFRYISQKNNYYARQIRQLRMGQLAFIRRDLDRSVVILFLTDLLELDLPKRKDYLLFLEAFLSHSPVRRVFLSDVLKEVRGLHFMREVQLIFQVIQEFLKQQPRDPERSQWESQLRRIPRAFAELFMDLVPLEIVDGDQGVISGAWLKAVMEQLQLLTGSEAFDPRVSVVSVMGVQSSGKSTFLNNLFNLSLHAKDARTTTGSSAIMLPLSAGDRAKNAPEFVILLDNEGLGSPENLNKFISSGNDEGLTVRDHKMVLFSAGVSDLCIVNSMKEFNLVALNIISQLMRSLIRLSRQKLQPAMSFVFQGVDQSQHEMDNLHKSSISSLKQLFEQNRLLLASEKRFQEVVRISQESGVETFPVINPELEFPEEYKSKLEEFKKNLFSQNVLFRREAQTYFQAFAEKVQQLEHLINYEDFYFDWRMQAEHRKTNMVLNFRVRLKRALERMIRDEVEDNNSLRVSENEGQLMKRLYEKMKYSGPSGSERVCLDQFYGDAIESGFVPPSASMSDFFRKAKELFETEFKMVWNRLQRMSKNRFIRDLERFRRREIEKGHQQVRVHLQKMQNSKWLKKKQSIGFHLQIDKLFATIAKAVEAKESQFAKSVKKQFKYTDYVSYSVKQFLKSKFVNEQSRKLANEALRKPVFIEQRVEKIGFRTFPRYLDFRLSGENSFCFFHSETIQKIESNILGRHSEDLASDIQRYVPSPEYFHKFVSNLFFRIENMRVAIPLQKTKDRAKSKALGAKCIYFFDLMLFCLFMLKNDVESLLKGMSLKLKSLFEIKPSDFFTFEQNVVDDLALIKTQQIILYKLELNLTQTIIYKAEQKLNSVFRHHLKIEMNKLANRENHIRTLYRALIKESETIKPEKTIQFAKKLILFARSIPNHLKQDVKSKLHLFSSKETFKDQVIDFIYEEFISQIRKITHHSKGLQSTRDFLEMYDRYLEIGSKGSQFPDKKIENDQALNKSQEKIQEWKSGVNSWKRILMNNLDEKIKIIFSRIDIRHADRARQDYEPLMRFCEEECADCGGVCIDQPGHKGAHEFYHIPLILKGT